MKQPILEIPPRLIPVVPLIHPFNRLTYEQVEKVQQLRMMFESFVNSNSVDIHPDHLNWCNDECLIRFLKSQEWNVSKALNPLVNTLLWRSQANPASITISEVAAELKNGRSILSGFGKNGHPIVNIKISSKGIVDYDLHLKNMVFNIETALSMCPESVDSIIYLADCSELNLLSQPPLSVTKKAAQIMTEYYAEAIVNPTWYVWGFYQILKVFFPTKTIGKIYIVETKNKAGKKDLQGTAGYTNILDHIDPDQLFTCYGGSYPFEWDFNEYCKSLKIAKK